MKKNKYIYLITGIFLFLINYSVSAQYDDLLRRREASDEYIGMSSDPYGDLLLNKNQTNSGEEIEDIRFGNNINDALFSHHLIQRAIEAAKAVQDEWISKQLDIVEKEIEKQLGEQFSNFNEAQKAYYKNLEKGNVLKYNSSVNAKYTSKINSRESFRDKYGKDYKLLELRANEIRKGITDSQYNFLQYDGIPLSQITSLNQIESLISDILGSLMNNEKLLFYDNKTYNYLKHQINRSVLENNLNHPILVELFNNQLDYYKGDRINNYFIERSRWHQLDLMQSYLNNVRFSMELAGSTIFAKDFGDADFIEDFAIKNRESEISIFDPRYPEIHRYKYQDNFCGGPINYTEWEIDKKIALDNLLNNVNTDDFAIENAQNELEDLTKHIPWKKSSGKIKGKSNLEYYESYSNGSAPAHFKLLDGSHVVVSTDELLMSKLGDTFESKFRDNINTDPNEKFYYIKPAGTNQWSILLFDTRDLKRELELMFILGAQELGKIIGTYVIPVEDIKILITGEDFAGQPTSRWLAAGMLLVEVNPVGKVFKIVAKVSRFENAWKIVVKVGDKTYTRVVKKITEEVLQHFDRYAPGTRHLIDDALRKGDFTDDVINEASEVIEDLTVKKNRKLTWEEIKALFKRGNDFNKKGRLKYDFNEIVLADGKRLDSYIPGEKIISRKATDIDNILESTWRKYCNELITKYKIGKLTNSSLFSIQTRLNGQYYLEIPLSNQNSPRLARFIQIAREYGIEVIFLAE